MSMMNRTVVRLARRSVPSYGARLHLRPFSYTPIRVNNFGHGQDASAPADRTTKTAPRRDKITHQAERVNLRVRDSYDLDTLRITDWECTHPGVVRQISLNSPKNKNAISKRCLEDLTEQVEWLHSQDAGSEVRSVVLSSELPDVFCAGADLRERASMSVDEVTTFLTNLRRTFARLEELPIPSYAAVSGHALGGGLELALCTTFRIFADHINIGLPETRLGIIPGAGGTYRLTRLIGRSNALMFMLTEPGYTTLNYLRMGLCQKVVSFRDDLYEGTLPPKDAIEYTKAVQAANHPRVVMNALTLAAKGLRSAPLAQRAALRAVKGCSPEAENEAYRSIIDTEDRVEALNAFREKRTPIFKGR